MAGQIDFDRNSFRFLRRHPGVSTILRRTLRWILTTLSLSALFWLAATLLITTDSSRALSRENRMYKRMWNEIRDGRDLLEDGVEALRLRDAAIYRDVFHTEPRSVVGFSAAQYLSDTDTLPDRSLVAYTAERLDALEAAASRIGAAWQRISAACARPDAALPPLSMPVEGLSYAQVGASTGMKVNPFYKVPVRHDGLDLIAPQGTDVLAAGPGTVTKVISSAKSLGDVVEIRHAGGYTSRYAHLEDICVQEGRSVRRGERIGRVGMTGKSFAPHLHYEVLRDGVPLDPVHYLFGSLSAGAYVNAIYMSVNIGQSMD